MSEEIFRNYYGKNYEKVKAAVPVEIQKMMANFMKRYPNATQCYLCQGRNRRVQGHLL
jgi:hypothetical protein